MTEFAVKEEAKTKNSATKKTTSGKGLRKTDTLSPSRKTTRLPVDSQDFDSEDEEFQFGRRRISIRKTKNFERWKWTGGDLHPKDPRSNNTLMKDIIPITRQPIRRSLVSEEIIIKDP